MIKRVKRSNCPKWIFTSQKNYKISMYLLAPFILQDLKNILRADPELCAIFRPKMTHLSCANFFWYKPFYYLHLKINPFHCAKFKNILTADPELWGCAIFGSKVVYLPPPPPHLNKIYIFWKIINIILIYLLAPFIVQHFKKILLSDPELRRCAIFWPKMTHFPKKEFFQKTC